jgi:hypothetical protein
MGDISSQLRLGSICYLNRAFPSWVGRRLPGCGISGLGFDFLIKTQSAGPAVPRLPGLRAHCSLTHGFLSNCPTFGIIHSHLRETRGSDPEDLS